VSAFVARAGNGARQRVGSSPALDRSEQRFRSEQVARSPRGLELKIRSTICVSAWPPSVSAAPTAGATYGKQPTEHHRQQPVRLSPNRVRTSPRSGESLENDAR
jgi:hypothetical protein